MFLGTANEVLAEAVTGAEDCVAVGAIEAIFVALLLRSLGSGLDTGLLNNLGTKADLHEDYFFVQVLLKA